ncbi:MarR family transcriptional regulator [Nocardia jinanensis]|uniref:MarR family transcriptional regulator n=1 Tax=Nocardia jinanensis TaxID=382504 RepID=A0A917S030_9NOCA|nr:MarR family transcriptional regulator [Nocardia jinanensis]GGL46299.1 MarR family transcriptional regulator [Nocardia jinanensis]
MSWRVDGVKPERMVSKARERRRLVTTVKQSLRDLRVQLSVLNHQVGTRIELKDVDLDCLDIINRHGGLSPSALARLAVLHPATMTGIIDRLERGGWVVRDRDSADRRLVTVRAVRDRNGDLLRHFSGMNTLMDELCGEYSDEQLELIADFLQRTTGAGREATDQLAAD